MLLQNCNFDVIGPFLSKFVLKTLMKVGLPKRIAAKLKEASLLSEVYLFKLQNVFVQIVKCICPNCEIGTLMRVGLPKRIGAKRKEATLLSEANISSTYV